MRSKFTERSKLPRNGRPDIIGHFTFNGVSIDIHDKYDDYGDCHFLIDEEYVSVIKDMNGIIDRLYVDIYRDNSDSDYVYSRITKMSLTTNIPGKIEIVFETNLPKDEVRSSKLDILISE